FAAGGGYEAIHEIFSGVGSIFKGVENVVGGIISAGTPRQVAMGDAQTALTSVTIPTDRPVVEATVTSTATVGTYDYIPLVNKIPIAGGFLGSAIQETTHKHTTVTQPKVVQIMAPENAITQRTVSELPNAANGDPRFAVTLTVNADSLYPRVGDPPKGSQLGAGSDDGVLPSLQTVVSGYSTDSKYTAAAANFGSNRAEVYCAQAIAPLIRADFQKYFYLGAELGRPSDAELKGTDGKLIAQYYNDIANKSVPVTVNLVNAKRQPVNPGTYTLNDAGYLMSNQALAKQLGADSNQKTTSSFSSECLSDPTAVEQQVAIQEGYMVHSGGLATEAAATNVTSSG
ncbi:MAG TPA: hypothetical protein VNG32_04065, partial [Candidatus Dormibacteraeota bacterium]|nr:hypothetical protein [Candidatus Dormibacteraeota bacterium]